MVVYGEKSSMNSSQKGSLMQKPFSVYNVIVQTLFAPNPEACSDANFDCFGTDNHGRQFNMMTSWHVHIFRASGSLCGESLITGGSPCEGPITRGFDVLRNSEIVGNLTHHDAQATPHYRPRMVKFVVTGGTTGCPNDKLHPWRQSCHQGNVISVFIAWV